MAFKVTFIFVDKTREQFIQSGVEEYLRRLRHYAAVEIKIVRGRKIMPKTDEKKLISEESTAIMEKAGPEAYLVALDSTGEQLTSCELAQFLTNIESKSAKEVVFIVGGPLGLSSALLDRCDYIFSLSKLTLTHEMSRLVLMEQIYRAYTIKAGGKYHK